MAWLEHLCTSSSQHDLPKPSSRVRLRRMRLQAFIAEEHRDKIIPTFLFSGVNVQKEQLISSSTGPSINHSLKATQLKLGNFRLLWMEC